MTRTIEGEEICTDIRYLIESAAANTKRLGFDMSQHATLVSLVTTEVAEALEWVEGVNTHKSSLRLHDFVEGIKDLSYAFEQYRKEATDHHDASYITNHEKFIKELTDIVIRIFSYVGANNWTEPFVIALADKMRENAGRPPKHNKGF